MRKTTSSRQVELECDPLPAAKQISITQTMETLLDSLSMMEDLVSDLRGILFAEGESCAESKCQLADKPRLSLEMMTTLGVKRSEVVVGQLKYLVSRL